jgi:hypothetical protein
MAQLALDTTLGRVDIHLIHFIAATQYMNAA